MEIAVSVSGLVNGKKNDRIDRAYFFFMQNGDLGGLHQASFLGEHEPPLDYCNVCIQRTPFAANY